MAIKTPQQYVESLKDGRVVYCNGEKIQDVTTHPILNICRDWVAMDYVLQSDSRYQDLLLEKDNDGELVSFALMPQKSREDLIRLREVVKLWARVCFGCAGLRLLSPLTSVRPMANARSFFCKCFRHASTFLA